VRTLASYSYERVPLYVFVPLRLSSTYSAANAMNNTRNIDIGTVLRAAFSISVFLCSQAGALSQELQFPAAETPASRQRFLYSDAKPYLNDSLSELQEVIPELRGLQPADAQKDPPALLMQVGQKTETMLAQMPDLISREAVVRSVSGSQSGTSLHQEFNYLIVFRRTTENTVMTEFRTDLQNKPIGSLGEDPRAPAAQGFALAWMRFHPARRPESQFRYLGKQTTDGRGVYVVAFAETPGLVQVPAEIRLRDTSFPVLCQGIAWIDESDFRILRLRTDLLAPLPEAQIRKLTTTVDFAEVRIPHSALRLWLPRKAVVEWETMPRSPQDLTPDLPLTAVSHYFERHSYSHYHLYQVEVKIGS
jgi:hypothetical protein